MRLDEIYALCRRHGFTPDGAATMTAIALAESGGNPAAECINCVPGVEEQSIGLYQINMLAWPQFGRTCLHDPDCSTIAAYTISLNGTWFDPWTTYKNGAYKKYYIPPDHIVTQGGQTVTPNAAQTVISKIAGATGSLTDKLGLGGVQPDDLQHALISLLLILIAVAMIFAGVFGLTLGRAKDVIVQAGKAGAL